jgi:hypothetical protein
MNNFRTNKYSYYIIPIIYLFCVFIYPITAIIILILGLPTGQSNFFLKILYLFIFFIFFIQTLLNNRKINIKRDSLFLFLFFIVYSFRLIIDVSFRQITFSDKSNFYVYSYYFGMTFFPSLILFLNFDNFDSKKILKIIYTALIIANILLLFYTLKNYSEYNLLATRININSISSNDDSELAFVGPLYLGTFGSLLILLSVASQQYKILRYSFFSNTFIVLIGITNLLISASRAPFILLIILLIFSIIRYLRYNNFEFRKLAKTYLFFTLFVLVFFIYLLPLINKYEIFLFQRIQDFFVGRLNSEKELRDLTIMNAFDQFLESPFYGSQFVLRNGQGYPHNIIIEVLMSTGLIGMFIILVCLLQLIKKCYLLYISNCVYNFIILTIALYIFLMGMTSGSIFVNPEIWVSISLITIMNNSD